VELIKVHTLLVGEQPFVVSVFKCFSVQPGDNMTVSRFGEPYVIVSHVLKLRRVTNPFRVLRYDHKGQSRGSLDGSGFRFENIIGIITGFNKITILPGYSGDAFPVDFFITYVRIRILI